jgi:hypothetical protein
MNLAGIPINRPTLLKIEAMLPAPSPAGRKRISSFCLHKSIVNRQPYDTSKYLSQSSEAKLR